MGISRFSQHFGVLVPLAACATSSLAQFAGFLPDIVFAESNFNRPVVDMVTGDITGDGVPDIVYLTDTGVVAYFTGDASGQIPDGATVIVGSDNDGRGIDLFDFDADGDLDLIRSGNVDGGSVRIYENRGGADFQFDFAVVGLGPISVNKGVKMGDFDGDGDKDVYVLTNNGISVVINTGTTFSQTPVVSTFLNFSGFTFDVADMDGDGRSDAAAVSNTGQIYLLEAAPSGLLDVGRIDFASITDMKLADIDLDGDPDLAYCGGGSSDGVIRIYRNDGTGTFDLAYSLAESLPDEIEFGDMNADGLIDFVVQSDPSTSSATLERFIVYTNNGAGVYNREPASWASGLSDVDQFELVDIAGFSGLDLVSINGGTGSSNFQFIGFRINATPFSAPSAFDLVAPVDAAASIALPQQVAAWGGRVRAVAEWERASGLGVSYEFVLATDPSLSQVVATVPGLGGKVADLSGVSLDAGTQYWWDVIASNSAGSASSANGPYSFTTAAAGSDCLADFDGNGSINILDVVTFVQTWQGGCP